MHGYRASTSQLPPAFSIFSLAAAEKQFAKGRDYYGTGHQAQIDDYLKAILTKGRPYVTFADAAESASMVFAAYASAARG